MTTINTRSENFRLERQHLYADGKRRCIHCLVVKDLEDFTPQANGANGIHATCKPCRVIENSQRRRKYVEQEPLLERLRSGYHRAQQKGLPAEHLRPEDLRSYWESVGIDPTVSVYSGKPLPKGWHLDHIQPLSNPNSKGHVLDNLVPCLPEENQIKHAKHFVLLLGRIHGGKE